MKRTSLIEITAIVLITVLNGCSKEDKIIKKDANITWTNPADIVYVTPLSSVQLNATTDVAGTFVYTPPAGTILTIGDSQDLKADFFPADTINYNVASKSVKINVKALGTVTDYDGNTYHTIEIGSQTWMLENLKVTHYRNGESIQNVTDNTTWTSLNAGAYCWYNNNSGNKDAYGALYNWFTVSDNRGLAPEGWHVPSDAEWSVLTTFLGGEELAGGKMKEAGLTHWSQPNSGATNTSGFSAIPSGARDFNNGTFFSLDGTTYWSNTEIYFSNALFRNLFFNFSYIYRGNQNKKSGYSVRCIKNQ